MSFYKKGTPEDEKIETGVQNPGEQEEKEGSLREFIITILIALAVGLFINFFILVNAVIPSGSMENTIMTGDRIFGSRLAYAFSEPERYDIVIFRYPDDEKQLFIKRIIGLPGETVVVNDGNVYVIPADADISGMDDEELFEDPMSVPGTILTDNSFCREKPEALGEGVFHVPEESYFMMGDNRNHSKDSRFWTNKYVAKKKILGKALLKYWPLNEIRVIKYGGEK